MKNLFHLPTRLQIALLIGAILLSAQLITLRDAAKVLVRSVEEREVDKISSVSGAVRALLDRYVEEDQHMARLLARQPDVAAAMQLQGAEKSVRMAAVGARLMADERTTGVQLVDASEHIVFHAQAPERQGSKFEGWGIAESLEGASVVVSRLRAGALVIDAISPLRHQDAVVGALVVERVLDSAFFESMGKSVAASLSLLSRNGKTVVASQGAQTVIDMTAVTEAFQRKIPSFRHDADRRSTSVYVPLTIVDDAYVMLVRLDSEAAYKVIDDGQRRAVAVTMITVVVGVTVGLIALWFALAPLRGLRQRAEKIAMAMTSDWVPVAGRDEVASVVKVLDTLTQLMLKRNSELLTANAKAEAGSIAKSRFLSSMSHEIRTPLNGVLGMAELLQQTRLDEAQARYVGAIAASGRSLHGLLGDILDLSKIEEGQVEIEHIDFDLQELLAETADVYRELASARGLVLSVQQQASVGRVNGDPGRLRQVLSNLLGNAIKFAERGQVRLLVQSLSAPTGDARSWQRFTVEDDGPGIAPEALARLFQRFAQADSSTTREYGGSGLGLVICRHLVELMGGSIEVHSEPGKGARFWFDLPLHAPVQAVQTPRKAVKAVRPIHARVLVAEDNQVNQQVIRGLLGHLGVQVTLVDDGAMALQRVQTQEFDLVVMDCQMPVMDGFEATRRIRAWESSQGARTPLPVIALTANALSGDREACLAAGMNDYVAKPITMASLGKILRRYLDMQDSADAPDSVLPAMLAEPAAPDYDAMVLAALPMVADGSEPEFAQHILGMFTDSAPATLDAIEQAVRQGDQATLVRLVHTFKSSAAQIGAAALAQEAARQERLLRAGNTAASDFPQLLRHGFARFKSAVAQPEHGATKPAKGS